MATFSAEWLSLREPADHAARPEALTADVATWLARHHAHRAVDLAGGTGSNIRYLLPRLPQITEWTLVDHDEQLLAAALATLGPLGQAHGVSIRVHRADLRTLDEVPFDGCALVTASALLDLVSLDWLGALADRCRGAGADVLFALNYDGRIICDPADPDDARVSALVNRHQRTDKGFGPALGPDAWREVKAVLPGWEVLEAPSDWRLGPGDRELQRQLVEGWSEAAQAIAPADAAVIEAWRARRLAHIDRESSHMRVGHQDVAAWHRPVAAQAL